MNKFTEYANGRQNGFEPFDGGSIPSSVALIMEGYPNGKEPVLKIGERVKPLGVRISHLPLNERR